jgi:hypothetical protein
MLHFEKHKLPIFFFFLTFLIFLNFFKALPYELLTFDGTQYLRMARSFWSFKFDYILPYRSPIVAIFLIPDVVVARIEIIILYIASCYLFYLFVKEKLKIKEALYSLIFFSLCWWNILFTSEIATEYFALFFLLLGFLVNNYLIRSFSLSLSFLFRPDFIVFILPFFIFLENDKKTILLFILFSFLIDILIFLIFYKTLNVSFINFFAENFIKKTPWKISPGNFYWARFIQLLPYYFFLLMGIIYLKMRKNEKKFFLFSLILVSLLGFLPFTNDRIFFLKMLLLVSISGAFLVKKLEPYGVLIPFIFIFINVVVLVFVQYPPWLKEFVCCPSSPFEFCSNIATSLFFESFLH